MNSVAKRIVAGLGIGFVIYLVVLPWFWPEPRIEASIPEQASLREDPEIELVIRAWHSNVSVSSVRFYVDYYASTAKGPNGIMNPTLLFEGAPNEFRGFFSTNLLTRPWSRHFTLKVPLHDFAQQGLLGPGILEGKLDVDFSYVVSGRRGTGYGGARARHTMLSVPFHITVVE